MSDSVNNAFLKLANEHGMFLETLPRLESALGETDSGKLAAQVKNLEGEFLGAIAAHFWFEEEIFFSAALESIPANDFIRKVLCLQKEHGILETGFQWLFEVARSTTGPGGKASDHLRREGRKLIKLFKEHARGEIHDVFPVMDKNPRTRQLVDFALKNRSIKKG